MASHPSFPVLTTDHLVLTIPPPTRARAMAAFVQDNLAHLSPWSPRISPALTTPDLWRRQLAQNRRDFEAGTSARFAIALKSAPRGRIIGVCNFTQVSRGPFCACYLGYSLDEHMQAKGYMTEALNVAIAFAFDELRLHRIMANYMPSNARSASVLRRLGFTVEGYARDYLFIDGAWQDHILTALTNPRPVHP